MLHNLPDIIAAAGPNIEFQMRCSFCNGMEEADGTLGVDIGGGNFMEAPIGPECLQHVRENKGVQWVDKPDAPVVD